MSKTIYLCDKKKSCCNSITCGGEYCNHTLDYNHAKNKNKPMSFIISDGDLFEIEQDADILKNTNEVELWSKDPGEMDGPEQKAGITA